MVRARGVGREAALRSLDQRLARRLGTGAVGVTPDMTVEQLAAHWMRHRSGEAQLPAAGQPRGGQGGPVSPQTLAGYQSAITRIVVPQLGGLRVDEAKPGLLDEALRSVAESGRSTGLAHTVLKQMFALAVRHDALTAKPVREVTRPRRRRLPVARLTVGQANDLLEITRAHTAGHAVDAKGRRVGGRRRSAVVQNMAVFLLATGCRIGEALALRWRDLDLKNDPPTVHIAATLVEPRKQTATTHRHGKSISHGRVFVNQLHRQPITKGGGQRTLARPDAAVEMLTDRRRRRESRRLDAPVFASATGGWPSPANQRTKLRTMLVGTEHEGVTPHVLRRTVGTLIAHGTGLDVAREILGHVDTSVTSRHHVAARDIAPDVRHLLDQIFTPAR